MPASRNGNNVFKSEPAKYTYLLLAALVGGQGVNTFTVSDQDRYTGDMHREYAAHIKEQHQKMENRFVKLELQQQANLELARDMIHAMKTEIERYSDKNAEDTKLELLLHLAENYLDKNEIPPDRVTQAIARAEQHHITVNGRLHSHDDQLRQLSERITKCCYGFERESRFIDPTKMAAPVVQSAE